MLIRIIQSDTFNRSMVVVALDDTLEDSASHTDNMKNMLENVIVFFIHLQNFNRPI